MTTSGLRPDEILVAVEAAAVFVPELAALDAATGRSPGSAAVGRVVEAGAAAGELAGQRVLVGPVQACGECDVCRRGHPAVCPQRVRLGHDLDGALAGRFVARARWATALTGPLAGAVPGPEAAALAREAPLAYDMASRAGVAPGETTIWLGGGPVARFGRAVATAKGAAALEPTPEELALPLDDLAAALRSRLPADAGPWKVFEVSGRSGWRARAAALAAPASTLVLAAGPDEGPSLWPALAAEVRILAVVAPHPDLVPETVALAVRGELPLAEAVEVRPAADVGEIVADLRSGRITDRLPIVVF